MIDYLATFVNQDGNSYPNTAAVNSTGPGTTDGTEYVKAFIDDLWGFNQALLNYTDDTPSGSAETSSVSQRLESIKKIVANIDTINSTSSYTIEEWNKHGILICAAGVGTVTLSAGTGVDQTNRVLVFNQAGSTIAVTTGGVNDFILDGEMIEYIYDGSSAWVRIISDPSILSEKLDTNSNYTILNNDGFDYYVMTKTTSSGTSTYTLPASPTTGLIKRIKLDQQSTGFSDYLIIDGNGKTIEGNSTLQLNGNGDFINIIYDGTEWRQFGFQASYETGWINRSDWTNVHIGSNTTKNVDSNVTHNLDFPLSRLQVKVLVSSGATDTNSIEISNKSIYVSGIGYGISSYYINSDNVKMQTGTGGVAYVDDSGNPIAIDAEDWYYKIIVTLVKI
jgi:hypothetical protein